MSEKFPSRWLNWNLEKKKKKLTSTLKLTLNLFDEGNSISEIAEIRNYKLQTVEYQIIELITMSFIDVLKIVSEEIRSEVLEMVSKGKFESLLEIKTSISQDVSYFEIKCVLADINRSP